jgi:hypothetical protein
MGFLRIWVSSQGSEILEQCSTFEGKLKNKNSIWSCRKKLCYPEFFFGTLGSSGSSQKTSKINLFIFITLNTSISTRKVMIYSMFISEVNNMRSFVLRAVMTSLGKKKTYDACF